MTTQQLTEYLPRPDGRSFKRKLAQNRLRTNRLFKAKVRKARSLYMAWLRRQYFLTSAYADLRKTIRRNEDIYLAVLMITVVLGYAYAVVAAQILFIFFGTAYAVGEATGLSMALLSLVTICVLGVSLAWVAAFGSNALSLSVMHGATNKKYRSLRLTLRESLFYTSRTTAAWTLVVATVLGPLMTLALGTAIALKAMQADMHTALMFVPYLSVLGVVWALYALLHYSLVPQVAVFEPQLSLSQAFSRSRQLVRSKGKLFLAATYGAFTAALAGVYGLSLLFEKFLRLSQSITIIFGIILVTIFTNGLLTMFYRKRRLARK